MLKNLLRLVFISLCFLITSNVSADVVVVRHTMPLKASILPIPMSKDIIRNMVADEFKDVPRMLDVIQCESGFRQFDSSGKTLKSNTSDYGTMQINQVHLQEAKRLGLDIFNSVEDNIKMGRIIYESQGLHAWTCNKMV